MTRAESSSLQERGRAKPIPVAVIVPVCDEAACIGEVVEGFQQTVFSEWGGVVAVGLNGTSDRSGDVAAAAGALVGEVEQCGYGHGCMAAIRAVEQAGFVADAYLFAAGDGANSPADLELIWNAYQSAGAGLDLLLAERTWFWRAEGRGRGLARTTPNIVLGLWASLLSGRRYLDLAPLRVMRRQLYEALQLQEGVWGWTIEAQVKAACLGANIGRVAISESPRLAGQQKVSGRGIVASAKIGAAIALAGLRARRRVKHLVDRSAALQT